MGKTNYTYPEVHPPQPPTQYRSTLPRLQAPVNDRFSWIPTPAQKYGGVSFHDPQRDSTVPPLPALPPYIQHDIEKQEQTLGEQSFTSPPQLTADHLLILSKQQEAAACQLTQQDRQKQYCSPAEPSPYKPHPVQPPAIDAKPLSRPEPATTTPARIQYTPAPAQNFQTPPPAFTKSPNSTIHAQSTIVSTTPLTTPEIGYTSSITEPQPLTGGTWAYSLFSCAEPTICLTGLFCPCILYSRVQRRLQLRSDSRDPTNILGHHAIDTSCLAWSLLCGINGVLTGAQRSRVRRTYNMGTGSGNVFGDCWRGCCCCCCALAQNEKEVMRREEGARVVVHRAGYTPPIGMTFAPPPR